MLDRSWLTPQLIRRLEALELSVKSVRAGSRLGGRYVINRRGSSIEFADYTSYYPGDDIRAIDWNLYARLDKLFIKTYKEEIALSVELIVDATASMGLPSADKFERAVQLAVCLGYIGVIGRHHVRLSWIAPGRRIHASPWFHQRRDVFRLSEFAASGAPGGVAPMAEWVRNAALAMKIHGGQAIVITDGMVRPAEFFQALALLLARNLEVKVLQVLTPHELHPAALPRGGMLVDAETGATHQLAYRPEELARAVAEHNELLVRYCKRHGIPFAQCRTDEPLEQVLTRTLSTRGFVQ